MAAESGQGCWRIHCRYHLLFLQEKGHTTHNCAALKAKLEREKKAEGAKKAEGEKAAAVTEFAGQASAVDYEANVTSSNIFHWNNRHRRHFSYDSSQVMD